MKPTFKTLALTLAKFAIPVAVIAFMLLSVKPAAWEKLGEQPKDYVLLVAALAVATAALSVSFVRWCVLVRCQGIDLSMTEAFRLGAIGFLLSFISAGSVGGDLFKAIFLAKRRPGKRVEAVASVFVDRGSGLYGLLLLVSVGLLFRSALPADAGLADAGLAGTRSSGGIHESIRRVATESPSRESALSANEPVIRIEQVTRVTVILVALGTGLLGILIFGGRGIDRAIRRAGKLPRIGGVISRVAGPLRVFHRHPGAFGFSVLLSVCVQSLFVLSIFLIARGLYADATPTLGEHFVIVPVCMLASALPITPAGVGVLELAMDQMYRIVPARATPVEGTFVALVFELVKIFMAILGAVFFWTAGNEVRESFASESLETATEPVGDGKRKVLSPPDGATPRADRSPPAGAMR